jgi:hypothetical protein
MESLDSNTLKAKVKSSQEKALILRITESYKRYKGLKGLTNTRSTKG